MATIRAEQVRVPRQAREAVARHEEVTVMNRERAVFVLVHPDDRRPGGRRPPGRTLAEAVAVLARAPAPDPRFIEDMEAVTAATGGVPEDPWAPS